MLRDNDSELSDLSTLKFFISIKYLGFNYPNTVCKISPPNHSIEKEPLPTQQGPPIATHQPAITTSAQPRASFASFRAHPLSSQKFIATPRLCLKKRHWLHHPYFENRNSDLSPSTRIPHRKDRPSPLQELEMEARNFESCFASASRLHS